MQSLRIYIYIFHDGAPAAILVQDKIDRFHDVVVIRHRLADSVLVLHALGIFAFIFGLVSLFKLFNGQNAVVAVLNEANHSSSAARNVLFGGCSHTLGIGAFVRLDVRAIFVREATDRYGRGGIGGCSG